MDRVILHCDCNCFFASVETVLCPEYALVPMAVCGSQEDRHSIVLAKNELAKKYGIQTAETVYSAKQKCPNLVIAKPHYEEYRRFSERVNAIYREYTDLVEPFGIDESWLDVTASQRLFGSGEEIAERIRYRVKTELGITVSIGVSFNKAFAKLGSDYKKPDAVTVISRANFKDIVYPLPVSDLLFIGKKTAGELIRYGIRTIGTLASADDNFIIHKFGKAGTLMLKYARGEDDSAVCPVQEPAKSMGNGHTFKQDITKKQDCLEGINMLCEELGTRLREAKMLCTSVCLTIKDEYLISIQRQARQEPPTDISSEIARTAYEILCSSWQDGRPIRMLTVTAGGLILSDGDGEQISLFDNSNEARIKKRKTEETADIIRQKFGGNAIVRGSRIDSKK